jgi:hypothetical protein
MVETLPPESHFYIVSNAVTMPEGGIGGVQSLPLALKSAKAYLDARTGASFRAEAEGVSVEDAKKLLDGLRGMSGLLRLTLKDDRKELTRLLDALQFYQEGATVKIQAEFSLETLMNTFKSLDLFGLGRA